MKRVSKPSRLLADASSPALRERDVELEIAALSSITMTTVTISPTSLARWSLRKARDPGRQSELGWRSTTTGGGMGMAMGLLPCKTAGFWICVSGGSSPTSDMRVSALHAVSASPIRAIVTALVKADAMPLAHGRESAPPRSGDIINKRGTFI